MSKEPEVVTVSTDVFDRRANEPRWAVVASYVQGERGDPVCIEYRVRLVRGAGSHDLLRNLHLNLRAMEDDATENLVGEGEFPDIGIPRYVFEQASQGRLLERARAHLSRNETKRSGLTSEARAMLAPPVRKAGRPPQRSTADKLRILAAIEVAFEAGDTLETVATEFHMSRSAVRDLLSWARSDAQPRLFTASGRGRKGGQLTPEARAMLQEIEGD